jgi:glycosyltransferase involved in cell wall biosynthesis
MRLFVLDYPGHPFAVELSRELARRGHEVRHAYFAADAGPKGRLERHPDDPPSFSIQPIAIRAAYSKSNLVRRHRLDRAFGREAARALAAFAPDVALVGQAPPNALPPLQAAARRRGIRLVLWLQDVFGLAAQALIGDRWLGLGRLAAGYYSLMESRALARADHVVAITDGFVPYLRAAGLREDRISVIPNWGPRSTVSPRPKRTDWSQARGLADKLVFSYSGTLGLKHNPRLLHELAKAFADRPDVLVQVTCTGVGGEWLKSKARAEPLASLAVLPLVPVSDLPDLYGAADVLVGLLEADAGAFSVPSKILAYLCAGRPVLFSAPRDNLAAQVLMEAEGGVLVPPDDTAAFIAAARALADDPRRREALGRAGRAYAERTFDIARIGGLFEAVLGAAGPAGDRP